MHSRISYSEAKYFSCFAYKSKKYGRMRPRQIYIFNYSVLIGRMQRNEALAERNIDWFYKRSSIVHNRSVLFAFLQPLADFIFHRTISYKPIWAV